METVTKTSKRQIGFEKQAFYLAKRENIDIALQNEKEESMSETLVSLLQDGVAYIKYRREREGIRFEENDLNYEETRHVQLDLPEDLVNEINKEHFNRCANLVNEPKMEQTLSAVLQAGLQYRTLKRQRTTEQQAEIDLLVSKLSDLIG